MFLRRLIKLTAAGLTLATCGIYAIIVGVKITDDPLSLRVCMDDERQLFAWTCKQVLYHVSWNPEDVEILNKSAGIRFAFDEKKPQNPSELDAIENNIKLFIARGVDINAEDIRHKRWTALHSSVAAGHIHEAILLLKHGARTDLRDTQGLTALDIALIIQQKNPANQEAKKMVNLLQSHDLSQKRN